MGRIGWIAGLVVALVVGFGAGWLVFGGGGGADDRARACASAEELPEEVDFQGGEAGEERLTVLSKISAVGMMAEAAGQDGDDFNDLDELGQAGRELRAVINEFSFDRYPDARQALLDAC